eukprot:g45884.t1
MEMSHTKLWRCPTLKYGDVPQNVGILLIQNKREQLERGAAAMKNGSDHCSNHDTAYVPKEGVGHLIR